jgi:hypothetical protein
MPQGGKSPNLDQKDHQASATEKGHEPKGVARPEAGARPWGALNKPNSGGKKFDTGRKVPYGPVGGSGRKTNLSRSS